LFYSSIILFIGVYSGKRGLKPCALAYSTEYLSTGLKSFMGCHATVLHRLTEMGEKTLWEGAQEISIESGDA